MEKSCDFCKYFQAETGICSRSSIDMNTCMGNASRPFWQPLKNDKEALKDFLVQDKSISNQDPYGIDQHAPGAKCDLGKLRVGLMFQGFARALLAVAEVVTYGAEKYTPLGFLEVPDAVNRYDDAKARHLLKGYIEPKDEESQLLHMQHEAWNALAKLETYLREQEGV